MYGYLKKPKLLMIAGSLALPEQTWKKQMILITRSTTDIITQAKGTNNVQKRTKAQISISVFTAIIFNACLTWNIVYFDE